MVSEQGILFGSSMRTGVRYRHVRAAGGRDRGLGIPVDSEALAAVLALRDRLDARISDAVAAHDRAALWELDGATSMTAWLVDRASMPRPRAAATTSR